MRVSDDLGCFTCGKCNALLVSQFFVGDGTVLCSSCSAKGSAEGKVCGFCKKAFTAQDKYVKEDEQYFHSVQCYSKWTRKKNMV